jgi:hypothetical protein
VRLASDRAAPSGAPKSGSNRSNTPSRQPKHKPGHRSPRAPAIGCLDAPLLRVTGHPRALEITDAAAFRFARGSLAAMGWIAHDQADPVLRAVAHRPDASRPFGAPHLRRMPMTSRGGQIFHNDHQRLAVSCFTRAPDPAAISGYECEADSTRGSAIRLRHTKMLNGYATRPCCNGLPPTGPRASTGPSVRECTCK